ncbi:MAG: citrate synthase [Bryobacteraceae bacterium]|nr:citrate synthase [Bryobacteraceae bacterium]
MSATGAGLEGIIAAESSICFIDGEAGVLSYQGFDINVLAENAVFEEVVFLLWNGRLPKRSELDDLKGQLAAYRAIPEPVTAFLKGAGQAPPMHVLRTAVSMLSLYDPAANEMSVEANRLKAIKLMSQTATIVSTFHRLRQGKEVVASDPSLAMAANFLYTLNGAKPDAVMEKVLDIALTLHADHELNASTFAARVTAATLSDIYSAVTSAIGALKGPLHGGANEDVIKMLLAAGNKDRALEMMREKLAKGEKIPGFGHRVYKVIDPRAIHLKRLSKDLASSTGNIDLYEASEAVQEAMRTAKGKPLNPNVDFYSASAYYSLGIPVDLFTTVFAISRMSGWTAHILEQYHNNRLIRPRAEYKGLPVGQAWVPVEARG